MQKIQQKNPVQQKTGQSRNILDGIIRFCLLTTLFLVPVVFSYWYRGGHELFFPIKIFFTQIPLIIALVFWILKTITSGEIRWMRSSLILPVFLFLASSILSLIGSINVLVSMSDLYRFFFYVLFYILFITHFRAKTHITYLLVVALIAFGVVNFYAILQKLGIDLLAAIGGRTGMDSTLGNPDFFAGYLIALIPISLTCTFIVNRQWRVFLGVLTVTGITFLFLTQSRAGFLGFIFSLLLLIFFILRSEGVKKEAKTWIFSITGIAIILLIALSFRGGTTLSRIRESMDLKSTNIRFRILCYESTWNIIKDHPITGTGLGTFYNVYPKYRVPEMKEVFTFVETPRYAHNDFLQIGSETGLLGLGAFIWLLFVFFKTGIRVLKEVKESYWRWLAIGAISSFAGMLVQMVFDFNFYRPETTLYFWLMPAILSVIAERSQGRPEGRVLKWRLQGWSRLTIGIAAIIIVPFMIKASLGPFVGNVHYNRGLRAEKAYNKVQESSQKSIYINAVLKEYNEAIKKENLNDIYYTKLGTFYGNLGREMWISEKEKKEYMAGAIENFEKALEPCPYYAGYHYNSGQSYLFYALAFDRKFIEKSEKRLKDALALSSYSEAEIFHNQLGLLYKEQGMLDKAIKEYEEALKINPRTIQSLINLGNAYYAKEWYDKAIETYFKSLAIDPNNVDALNNLANVYYQKRMFDKAVAGYKKALSINPGYIDAYNNLGSVYFVAGMHNEAKAQFLKTIELVPNSPQANYARAMLSRIP